MSPRTAAVPLVFAAFASIPACHGAPAPATAAASSDLSEVAAWMRGTFASTDQHHAAPKDFFDIRLVMLPIWTERDDGPWLYVEQAVATATTKPYRQRVYHLIALPDGRVRSDVYTLPGDPLPHAGAWTKPRPLAGITPDALSLRGGCSIVLQRRDATTWVGSTEGDGCPSERSGAAYATAEVTLTPAGMFTLDRGYDAQGKQVWGSTQGAYHFVKRGDGPPAA